MLTGLLITGCALLGLAVVLVVVDCVTRHADPLDADPAAFRRALDNPDRPDHRDDRKDQS
jgi:hypothetical protein